jgi:hypothetical protein
LIGAFERPINVTTQQHRTGEMDTSKYDKFKALDPFFNVVMKGLDGLVDGVHFWDVVADEAVFEFLYRFPGWPERLEKPSCVHEGDGGLRHASASR